MAAELKRFRPNELTEPLLNPHKGCSTFQRFNGDRMLGGMKWVETGPTEFPEREYEGVAPGYLPCTVAYCRWFWTVFEPEEGKFDWSMIEKSLATCEERGQTLQVRLMPHGSNQQSMVPQWYRDRYETIMKETHKGAPENNVPIYDSPEFIDKWGAVVTDFGRRFDGHPWLESVDVSFIGPWGEGAGECSVEGIDRIVANYKAAHPKTPLMTMISEYKMTAGVRAGMGWRLDCFGDIGTFGKKGDDMGQLWMHHYDCYPKHVCICGAQDAWKKGPITYESCGVPMNWYKKGFDLDFILKQGYKFHGSIFMPKSAALPEEYMEPLSKFCDRIGYKFILRQAIVEERVEAGGRLNCEVWVENVGIAPIYHKYDFALRLTQGKNSYIYCSSADVKTWIPDDIWLQEAMTVPKDFSTGKAMLEAALIRSDDETRTVRFANEGNGEDGWLELGTIEIVK